VTDIFSNRAAILLGATVIALLWAALVPQSLAQRAETTENKPVQLTRLRVNGVDLHYLEIGKGVPVIFVHGGLDDYRMWDAQLKPFSQQYRVIAYSRRYNYPNNNPRIHPDHSAIAEADDLAALIKKLKLGPAHIVGHSYGALTALFLAVRYPQLVRTLVLAEPPVMQWAEEKAEGRALLTEFMGNLWKPAGEAFRQGDREQALRVTVKYFAGEGVFDQVPEAQRKYWMGNLREWQALTTSRDAFPALSREDVKRIKAPALMLSGERTLNIHKFVDGELQPLLLNGERVMISNASHDMWSELPEACGRAALAFLAKR
jgi:non-heme chloroperoxidase